MTEMKEGPTSLAPMTPYQRCLATIAGRTPDRVPAYTPTIACDVASKLLGRPAITGGPHLWYAEARAWMQGESAHAEFEQRYEADLLALHRLLGMEVFRYGWRRTVRPAAQLDDRTFLYGDAEGAHQIWRWDEEVMNFVQVVDTAPQRTPEEWPTYARQMAQALDERVARTRQGAGAAEALLQERLGEEMMVIAAGGGLSVGHDAPSLMAALLEPGAVGDVLDCQLEIALAQAEGLAAHGIAAMLGGGDMADKNGPMYSPRIFRELVLPRLKVLAARCNELGVHYVWRTDGNIWLVGDMIFREAGVPGCGEVDYEASMTMTGLRQRYPRLVVWANASGDRIRRGTYEQVYQHCTQILTASEGRGYFHGCSNTVLPGTPPENVWAMMQARDDYARSGLGNR